MTHADHTFTLRYFLCTDVFSPSTFTHKAFADIFFAHRNFYTQTLFTPDVFTHKKSISTQVPLHGDAFTHRSFLHTHTHVLTHRSFYKQVLLHGRAFTHMLLHTKVFTRNFFNPLEQTISKSLSNRSCNLVCSRERKRFGSIDPNAPPHKE